MNLSEWRALKAEGEEAQLPSGLVVRVKRVGLVDLAEQGKIPQTLQPQIDEIGQIAQDAKKGKSPGLDQVGRFTDVLEIVCRACLVGPEGLDVGELDFTDKMAIFTWANEAAVGLKTFRVQQAEPLGVGRNGTAVRAAA